MARTPVLECHTTAISIQEVAGAFKDAVHHRSLASKAWLKFDGFTDMGDGPFVRLDPPAWNAEANFSNRELYGSVALIVWQRPTGLQIRIGWDSNLRARLVVRRLATHVAETITSRANGRCTFELVDVS